VSNPETSSSSATRPRILPYAGIAAAALLVRDLIAGFAGISSRSS
jgi:hypothetical protein